MKVLTCRVWILIKKVEISPMRASKSRCPRTFALPCSRKKRDINTVAKNPTKGLILQKTASEASYVFI